MAKRLEVRHTTAVRPVGPGNWSPDGENISFVAKNEAGTDYLWVCSSKGGWARQVSDRRVALEMGEGTDRRDIWGGPSWSPDGSQIAFTSASSQQPKVTSVWSLDLASGETKELTHHDGADMTPRWSPDGSQIAFIGHRNGRDDIQTVPAGGGVAMQLTYDRWDNIDLNWSPDGKWIVFISQRSDVDLFSNNICIVPADGGSVLQLTKGETANDRSPQWSPSGKQIVFVSNRDDDDDIWRVDVTGSNLIRLTQGKGERADPRWSPDGKWIAYTHFFKGNIDLCVIPAEGGSPRVVASGGCNVAPRWSPDGTRILYHRSGAGEPGDLWCKKYDAPADDLGMQITDCARGSLAGIEFCTPEIVTYRAEDGLEIEGLLYRPPAGSPKPGPAIVYVHGGPNSLHLNGWFPIHQYLVQRGYTILAPNYRGSTGYGKAFMEANIGEKAGADVGDWVEAASFLRRLPEVDPNRVAIMGRSAGGYATLLALGQVPDVFQAGIAISAPSSWFTYWDDTEIAWTRRFRMKLMGLPSANRALYERRSPINFAKNFKVPVLIMHGAADPGVPCNQAREMAAELTRLGKKHECVIYSGEGHQSSGAAAVADSVRQIEKFLAEHLAASSAKSRIERTSASSG